ncbi:MAG: DegT/DnrJ/EryC1/StrS family aminotransferase [Phycisphaeraceae bacterium]|nr:DegT/DnrJ/EryC1/StrS family aminotransferase [Phycisphaeraceae bacterium]
MAVPLLDLSGQHAALLPEFRAVFERAVTSGQFILGPEVQAFEARLAAYCRTRHALAISSGTDALLLALMALDIKAGDEVITSPFTFFATAGCIARVGAVPVFVDIDPATFNIDPTKIAPAITPRTRAIMPVHLFGQVAEMEPIMKIARDRKLAVIEDAAQAIGSMRDGKIAGSIGEVGCLSFYPSKNLAALGDAGACTTNDTRLYERLRALRVHGEETRYHHSFIGGNFRLDALQASWLAVKLPHLDGWAAARRANAQRYQQSLAGLPLGLPTEAAGAHHVFNQFTIRVPGGRRDALKKHLDSRAIGAAIYYPLCLHMQKCFEYLGGRAGDFPIAEQAAAEVLSLPIFPEMTAAQQDEVIAAVREFFA